MQDTARPTLLQLRLYRDLSEEMLSGRKEGREQGRKKAGSGGWKMEEALSNKVQRIIDADLLVHPFASLDFRTYFPRSDVSFPSHYTRYTGSPS